MDVEIRQERNRLIADIVALLIEQGVMNYRDIAKLVNELVMEFERRH